MDSKPMSIDEAADFLGLAKGYLYKLTSKGEIPFYKPRGGRIFFRREELEAFVFRGRRAADFELQDRADKIAAGRPA